MKSVTRLISIFALALAVLASVPALEIETFATGGNLAFPSRALTGSTLTSGTFYAGGSLRLLQPSEEGVDISAGYLYDPVLGNLIHSAFLYRGNYFSLGAGPVFGFLNSKTLSLNPGVRANFLLQWPGRFFAETEVLGSLGNRLRTPGEYSQNSTRFALGLYLHNAVLTLSTTQRDFFLIRSAQAEEERKATDYAFTAGVFQKNIPYRLTVGIVFRVVESIFTDLSATPDTQDQKLNSLILQTRGEWDINNAWTVFADLSSSVFSYGTFDAYAATSTVVLKVPKTYFFELSIGGRYRFLE
jgi:hypothetical protein